MYLGEKMKLAHNQFKSLAKLLYGLWHVKNEPEAVEEVASIVFEGMKNPHLPASATLCSAQAIVESVVSLNQLAFRDDSEEASLIPQAEFDKFAIDFMIFNLDRHTGNVLAKKVTITELQERISKADTREQARLNPLLEHARDHNSEYVYELHLIDHGLTFPDPEIAKDDFGNVSARLDFCSLPQAEGPFSLQMSERILELDPQTLVDRLRQDTQKMQAHYGTCCQVSPATYQLLHFSSLALQEGVRQGLTIKQLAELYKQYQKRPTMKCELLNDSTVIYRYDNDTNKIEIFSPLLQEQLSRGIEILTSQRVNFNNKRIVKLNDPDFHRAFEAFFVPKLDQSVFHWRIVP
jgi:hypothetical protein